MKCAWSTIEKWSGHAHRVKCASSYGSCYQWCSSRSRRRPVVWRSGTEKRHPLCTFFRWAWLVNLANWRPLPIFYCTLQSVCDVLNDIDSDSSGVHVQLVYHVLKCLDSILGASMLPPSLHKYDIVVRRNSDTLTITRYAPFSAIFAIKFNYVRLYCYNHSLIWLCAPSNMHIKQWIRSIHFAIFSKLWRRRWDILCIYKAAMEIRRRLSPRFATSCYLQCWE